MVLVGDYESIRDFIFELESAPEFVIIDDVTLVESDEAEQTLTIDLSTYFQIEAQWRLSGAGSCVLAVVAVALAALAYRLWPSSTAATCRRRLTSGARRGPRAEAAAIDAPDVHLEALDAERSKPQEMKRNLFRFRAKAPPPPPPSAAGEAAAAAAGAERSAAAAARCRRSR